MILYHLDVFAVLGFVVQFVLPLVVGLVTNRVTSSRDQFLILAALTAITSVITGALTAHDAGTPFDLVQTILTALAGLLVSIGTHFGIWKPTGLADTVLGLFRKAPAPAVVTPLPTPPSAPAPVAAAPAPAVQ